MSGRRSHSRFLVANPWSGAVTLQSDVVVTRTQAHELFIISNSAGVRDEELSLDVYGAGEKVSLKVRVLDSRPVIVDGAVRHGSACRCRRWRVKCSWSLRRARSRARSNR